MDKSPTCRLVKMTNKEKETVKDFTLIGRKIGMTQVYDSSNCLVPVTVVEVGPCPVTQIKTIATDKYSAIQIGFGSAKSKNKTQAELGHLKKTNTPPLAILMEFRTDDTDKFNSGDILTVASFIEGETVDVRGMTIGHGTDGVMGRHGFAGNPATHGSMMHRRGGSYGARQTPGHVYKQRKMPGHHGCKMRTVQNLKIIKIVSDKNLILVKGSFPGSEGTYVTIRRSKKIKRKS